MIPAMNLPLPRPQTQRAPLLILSHRGESPLPSLAAPAAGGLTSGLIPLIRSHGGTWICAISNASHSPSEFTQSDRTSPYRLLEIPLEVHTHRGHYQEISNRGLWPLCHRVFEKPVFSTQNWTHYQTVNRQFARTALKQVELQNPKAILIQDYHLATCAGHLRSLSASSHSPPLSLFWHIPWPEPHTLKLFPWGEELLKGMLGNNLIGFHTHEDRDHFIQSCKKLLPHDIDFLRSQIQNPSTGFTTSLSVLPLGGHLPDESRTPDFFRDLKLGPQSKILLGVDRLDYTKGLFEKLQALSLILEKTTDQQRENLVFIQIATPTRDGVPEFAQYRESCHAQIAHLKQKHEKWMQGHFHWIETCLEKAELRFLYETADLCWVNSLHDGLNLVAKEYLLARDHPRSALILSRTAGCAKELVTADLTNPFDREDTANTVVRALSELSGFSNQERFKSLQTRARSWSALQWGEALLEKTLDSLPPSPLCETSHAGEPPKRNHPLQAL